MKLLIVGGAGYLGSHVVRECIRQRHEPVVFDNFSTGHHEAVKEAEQIQASVMDTKALRSAFENDEFDGVIQLAGSPSTRIATRALARHYQIEVGGTLNVLQAMLEFNVPRFVYVSSVKVYGTPTEVPIPEDIATAPRDPIGRAKLRVEDLIREVAETHPLRHVILRVFNVAGADPAGDIGEAHRQEDHLIPRIFQATLGKQRLLTIHGSDYDTPDATCIRDFVHVNDVARAVLASLVAIEDRPNETYNIGSGEGYSLMEVVQEAQKLVQLPLSVVHAPRRMWQPAALVAGIDKARTFLDWEPFESDLTNVLKTAWNWHRRHPNGFHANGSALAKGESETTELFGDIAVRLGLVTENDVVRALERQKKEMEDGNQHKLIGMHMLEMGLLSTSALIEILKYYEER